MTGGDRQTFEMGLEGVRRSYGLCVFGYVVMPEHVYLPLSETQRVWCPRSAQDNSEVLQEAYIVENRRSLHFGRDDNFMSITSVAPH